MFVQPGAQLPGAVGRFPLGQSMQLIRVDLVGALQDSADVVVRLGDPACDAVNGDPQACRQCGCIRLDQSTETAHPGFLESSSVDRSNALDGRQVIVGVLRRRRCRSIVRGRLVGNARCWQQVFPREPYDRCDQCNDDCQSEKSSNHIMSLEGCQGLQLQWAQGSLSWSIDRCTSHAAAPTFASGSNGDAPGNPAFGAAQAQVDGMN